MKLRLAWWTIRWALTPPARKRAAMRRDVLEARMGERSE